MLPIGARTNLEIDLHTNNVPAALREQQKIMTALIKRYLEHALANTPIHFENLDSRVFSRYN